MSEVLNAKVTDSDENAGFSRRRVVKGVAWSVPVIVTAIAAPAAAASGLNATVAFAGTAPTFVRSGGGAGGGGTNRRGTGPTALEIQNSGGAINGPITGTINITPVGPVDVGVGVQSISSATLTAAQYSTAHAYDASFAGTLVVASGQRANFPIQFQYENVNPLPKKDVVYAYRMTMTVRLPDGTPHMLDADLTITF